MADSAAKKQTVRLAGKEWPLRPRLEDDWEMMEIIAEGVANPNDPSAVVRSAKYVLNDDPDAYAALKLEATMDTGRVSTQRITEILRDAIASAAPN